MYLICIEETYRRKGYPLCIVDDYIEFMETHESFFAKEDISDLIVYKKDKYSEFLEKIDYINVYEYYEWVTDE